MFPQHYPKHDENLWIVLQQSALLALTTNQASHNCSVKIKDKPGKQRTNAHHRGQYNYSTPARFCIATVVGILTSGNGVDYNIPQVVHLWSFKRNKKKCPTVRMRVPLWSPTNKFLPQRLRPCRTRQAEALADVIVIVQTTLHRVPCVWGHQS